ncbi:MAG: response regulator transcription factor [Bacteroidales bacterium]
MKKVILIVDDDLDIVDLIELYLNHMYSVLKASNGKEALEILGNNKIDLVLLDVMMPEMDGFITCLHIRKQSNVPVIFITAKGLDGDIVHGLSVGADDYIVKPFNSVILLAKLASLLRRTQVYNLDALDSNLIRIGELIINIESCKVIVSNKEVKLTHKEFEILLLLAKNKGCVYSLQQIHDSIWGENDHSSENSIMVHIANLRSKIEQYPRNPHYIKTVWGFGYKI